MPDQLPVLTVRLVNNIPEQPNINDIEYYTGNPLCYRVIDQVLPARHVIGVSEAFRSTWAGYVVQVPVGMRCNSRDNPLTWETGTIIYVHNVRPDRL